jgi:DNA-binding transcriptional LysR family regulator
LRAAGHIDAFLDFPWVCLRPGDEMSRRLQDLFDDVEFDAPRPTIVTRDVPLAAAIPNASVFITVLPPDVAILAVSMGRLAVLPVELPGPPDAVGAMSRRDVPQSTESAHFVESLRSELVAIGITAARSP